MKAALLHFVIYVTFVTIVTIVTNVASFSWYRGKSYNMICDNILTTVIRSEWTN